MRRITLSALALVSSLGVTGIARAGCCDDFWSCAAAVASAGVSCQVQGVIDAVNATKRLVETVTNDLRNSTTNIIAQAQRAVGDASNDMKQVREQSMSNLQQAAQKAHELANAPRAVTLSPGAVSGLAMAAKPGGAMAAPIGGMHAAPGSPPVSPVGAGGVVVAPPKPADPGALKEAMGRADAFMQDLRTKTAAPANEVVTAEAAAIAAATRHVRAAAQISLDLALAPLNLLRDSLLDMLTHPERLLNPSAQIEADIQRITDQVPAMLTRIAGEITQEAMGNLEGARAHLQKVQDAAAGGQAVVDALQKLANSKLQSDLDALDRLVPKAAPAATGAPGMMMLPVGIAGNRQLIVSALARTDPAKLPIVIQQKAAISDIASKWQSIKVSLKAPPQLEPGAAQKVERDLGQMFAGKGRPDVEKKKLELLEEAKKRFASDPKTLEKVRQYIETHAPKG